MKRIAKTVCCILISAGMMLLVWALGYQAGPFAWARWLFAADALALIVLYGFGIAELVKQSRQADPDAAARDAAQRRKQEIIQNAVAEQAAIAELERKVWKRWTLAALLYLILAMSAGASHLRCIVPAGVVCVFCFYSMPAYALCDSEVLLPDAKTRLHEKDYPLLFGMVREEAKRSGYDRKLQLFLGSTGIGVFRGKRTDGLLLPPIVTGMLTKNELRQVLRHEFSHLVSKELELEQRWLETLRRGDRTLSEMELGFFGLIPVLPAIRRLEKRFEKYRAFSEKRMEAEADQHGLSREEARDAVAAIAKAGMFEFFNEEDRVSTYRCYEGEKACVCQTTIRSKVFEEMLEERGKIWLSELENEALAPFASHPTFSQRRAAYGVTDYDAFSVEKDAAWLTEMNRLCEQENAYLAAESGYAQTRGRMYLDRRSRMELYESSDDPLKKLEPKQIIEAAEAYFGLDTPKAIFLLRALLRKDPENLDAKQLLGMMLLDERRDEGVAILYQNAEYNGYTIPALSAVGNYVYRRGNAKAIQEYECRSTEIIQRMEEFHDRMDEIRLKDLKPRTMPDSLLNLLTDDMVRAGGGRIAAIACAAKDFSENEDAHVFVLKYSDEDDEERNEEIFMKIFDQLNRRKENYALRDDDELSIAKMEKQIPNCIVYPKKNGR